MKIGRYGKFDGHLPYCLPTLYVCAECGGEIRCCCTGEGGYKVTCRADERHDGLVSRDRAEPEEAYQAYIDARREVEELMTIAKELPERNGNVNTAYAR